MALIKSSESRAVNEVSNERRVFIDSKKKVISTFALIDNSGEQIGTLEIPIYAEILKELKINNAYLQEIVGEKLTEIDLED